jgi:hypothetical protein
MPQRLELATEVMGTDAGLHADQTRGHIGKTCFDLATRPLLPQHDCATTIETNDVERVLTDINADYGNRTLCCRSHGMLLVLAPLASLSLAGQEHGRTIPLPDISRVEIPHRNSPD